MSIQQQPLKMDAPFTTPSNNNNQPPMKLPIPRLLPGSTGPSALTPKSQELLLTSAWPNTTTTSPSSLPVVQSHGTTPPGKPVPNKRGRKPLTTMPSTKKHIQNLTNQRAFRQRRENYIRNLEARATTLEYLYQQAQEEIKNLKEQLRLLNKQLIEGDRNVCGGRLNPEESMEPQQYVNRMAGGGVGGIDRQIYTGQTMVGERIHTNQMFSIAPIPRDGPPNDIVMSEAAMSPSSGSDGSNHHSPPMVPPQQSNGMFIPVGAYQQQCLSPTSPTSQYVSMSGTNAVSVPFASGHSSYPASLNPTLSSANFYEQDQGRSSLQHSTTPPPQRQQQLQHMRTQHQDSVQQSPNRRTPLAEDLLKDQLFCETKNGELCYCEPDPASDATRDLDVQTKVTFQSMGAKAYLDRDTGKRMWILPNDMPPNSSDPMTASYVHNSNDCSSSSSPRYSPPLPSPDEPDPQWQLQQQYYSQATTTATSPHHQSSHHQNNSQYGLKWILGDVRREEPICSGSA